MKNRLFYLAFLSFVALSLSFSIFCTAQTTTVVDDSRSDSVIVIAGKQYQRSALHNLLWGKYYRKVWSTPVTVKRLNFDTTYGGLTPKDIGGGKQTKNLRLEAANGRQYAIRSIDKRYGKSLPDEFVGTFIEKIVDDQMSAAHPYAGLVVKNLASAAGLYHTNPQLVYVGDDPKLDTFRQEYGKLLYSLEDRPTDDNAKFYGAEDVIDNDDLLERMEEENDHYADQQAFAKARLFDMFIGDWDRHTDQWKWAQYTINGKKVYKPLPKDRDQAFSSYDGLIVKRAVKAAKAPQMQVFENTVVDVPDFTYWYRDLDMRLTNRVTLDTWISTAKELQQQLTDSVIEHAVRQFPPEIYAISGREMTDKLKTRKNDILKTATTFYYSLAREVDVLASKKNELVELTSTGDNTVQLRIYSLDNQGRPNVEPFYNRTFNDSETEEIRVYGIDGNDQFKATGNNTSGITIRLIGGDDKDTYDIPASFGRTVNIYDNHDNTLNVANAKLRLSKDTTVHDYDPKSYKQNEAGIKPKIGYNNDDRLYVGLGYRIRTYGFRKSPFASSNEVMVKYSITQQAFNYGYEGMFIKALGNWHIGISAEYDEVRDQDFLGIGNNTILATDVRRYYRYRNVEGNAFLSFIRNIDSNHTVTLSGGYQLIKLLNDPGRFLAVYHGTNGAKALEAQHFGTARIEYDFTKVSDKVVPRKGIRFNTAAEYTMNLKNKNALQRISGLFGVIFPVGPFTIASKVGAATLWGEPEFYQLNKLGGGNVLRGFVRWRFYGNTIFYNQNELQLNFNVKTYLYSGKMGLVGLLDNGRVWHPGETSDKWHYAVGGGLTLAPFNKISATVTYAVSNEAKRISVRLGHFLRR